MKGPLDWGRWALKQGELWGLGDGEARLLSVLAAHVNRHGEVAVDFLSESEIARRVGRSPRTVRRLLVKLRLRGLVTSEQRGRGVAKHILHDVLPVEQLSIDLAGTPPRDGFDRPPVSGRPTGQPDIAVSGTTGHLGVRQEREEDLTEEEDARESTTGQAAGLVAQLADVVDLLADAPGVIAEPASVNAILAAFPLEKGYDHLRAAYTVLSWAHEGGLHVSAANRLLERALLRQDRERPRSQPAPPRVGRFDRSAPPRRTAEAKPWDGALRRARERAEHEARQDEPERVEVVG